MASFWILTGGLALVTATLLVLALLRGRAAAGPSEAYDLRVYRDQLKEIERDAARGVIAPAEAERLRNEIARRILDADRAAGTKPGASPAGRGPAWAMASLIAALIFGGGYFLYAMLGAPGYGDLSRSARIAAAEEMRATRPSQEDAEAQSPDPAPRAEVTEQYLDLVQRLRGAVAERPDELQGWMLLARSEAALGNFAAAHAAQSRIIALKGADATARDYADLADMRVLAAGGYVSPAAERAAEEALARDPGNGVARYYIGLMYAQTGRPDRSFTIWDALLRDSRAEDPWVSPVAQQIEGIAQRAGVTDYQPPLPAPAADPEGGPLAGPSDADVAAAADMTPEQRADMVRSMVDRLGARLAQSGGTAEEWARLIGALAVLGRAEDAMEIYAEAQQVFADDAAALDTLRDAATGAGVGQ